MKNILLIFGLLWALGASGQIYIDSYRFGAAPAAGLLLDDYPNAAAAYSLRLLRTAYTGNCIEVRRVSDGTLSNIGFSGNYLDTAALKTFCAGTNCVIRTWYDQSGAGLNAQQTTNAQQPTIVTSGALRYSTSGQVAIFFNGGQRLVVPSSTTSFKYLHDGTTSMIAMVVQAGIVDNSLARYVIVDNCRAASTGYAGYYTGYFDNSTNNNAVFSVGWGGSGSNGFSNNAQNVFTPNTLILYDDLIDADDATAANRSDIKFNAGTSIANNTWTGTTSITTDPLDNMTFGSTSASTLSLTGYIAEIVMWDSNQSSNRTGIQGNINSFYSLY